ncbi:lysylphosphatidylglycerol synthetase-like protein (DUF2156 family) [Fictibacillus halophilus]|uniref:Lysylphosphatidylglycerol synthetase-like protein (DUF2156 family) n=1 Tax=Fictibacillus halophilus TaxID=1610490 RepID=A0ABV2LN64_9BACL
MVKKRKLVKEEDPIIYRVTGYLPPIVLIIGWIFFLFYKSESIQYASEQSLSWEPLVTSTLYFLQITGIVLSLFFILMLLMKSRRLLYMSPVPFSMLMIVLLTLPSLLHSAVMYRFIMSGTSVFIMVSLTICPILLIFLYVKRSEVIWLLFAAIIGFVIVFLPFLLSDALDNNMPGYRPYKNLLASNCLFYFSFLIAFFVLYKYFDSKKRK